MCVSDLLGGQRAKGRSTYLDVVDPDHVGAVEGDGI